MRVVIVTGMSGAGKSSALKMLEDAGYFCIDNLPVPLMLKLTEFLKMPRTEISKTALGIDIRNRQNFEELKDTLDTLDRERIEYEIVFLDAADDVLVKRYKETRRTHPLAEGERIEGSIQRERESIRFLKEKASYIIDTSNLLTRELKKELEKIFVRNHEFKNLYITILSFGFKYGIPNDADLVFDVRFLPNPYYLDELRPLSGNDAEVRDYVMRSETSGIFLEKLTDLLNFLIPNYINEGKYQLVIAVGCTGGKHRSVTLANALFGRLAGHEEYGVRIEHRDIDKDTRTKLK